MSIRRQSQRGIALLAGLGFITVLLVAVVLTLTLTAGEAEVQGTDRRQRTAFFAAEAGFAEGKEVARLMLGSAPRYTQVIATLATACAVNPAYAGARYVREPGFPATATDEWWDLIGWTPYELTRGNGEAVDPGSEAITASTDYPTNTGVRYRVFMRNDQDGGSTCEIDTNKRVWIISVGEVANPGGMPIRAVVQAMVSNRNGEPGSGGITTQRGLGADKNFANLQDSGTPDVSSGTVF